MLDALVCSEGAMHLWTSPPLQPASMLTSRSTGPKHLIIPLPWPTGHDYWQCFPQRQAEAGGPLRKFSESNIFITERAEFLWHRDNLCKSGILKANQFHPFITSLWAEITLLMPSLSYWGFCHGQSNVSWLPLFFLDLSMSYLPFFLLSGTSVVNKSQHLHTHQNSLLFPLWVGRHATVAEQVWTWWSARLMSQPQMTIGRTESARPRNVRRAG